MTRVAKTFAKVLDNVNDDVSLIMEFERDFKLIVNEEGFEICGETDLDGFEVIIKEYYLGVFNSDIDSLLLVAWLAYRHKQKRAGKVILKIISMWINDLKEE